LAIRAVAAACLALLAWSAGAVDVAGTVASVQDGDTLTFSHLAATYRVRLVDIDAPEAQQPFGDLSAASLRELCHGKSGTMSTQGKDRYGRVLARVTCAGVDANVEQVRLGMAWVFVRYAPKDSPLYQVEREARLDRRGLWAEDAPVPPWEWRRRP